MCLEIGFPPLRTVLGITDMADPDTANKCGIGSGWRHHLIYTENPASTFFATFDYGSIFAADYLYIPKLALTPNITEIAIETSTDNATYTEVYSTTTIEFQGNNNEDLFITFPPIGPSRYWRVGFAMSPATPVFLSKIYLGNLFSFGTSVNPASKQRMLKRDANILVTTSGRIFNARTKKTLNVWDINIKNLSDLVIENYLDNVLQIEKRYVVLYDSLGLNYFNEQPVWHGVISNSQFEKVKPNINNIRFTFTEMP